MKKRYILVLLTILMLALMFNVSFVKANNETKQSNSQSQIYGEQLKIGMKANKDKPNSAFVNKDNLLFKKHLPSDAKITNEELITYGEFIKKYNIKQQLNESTFSHDRMLWVSKVYYPSGFQTRHGNVKNALAILEYDAETGISLGFGVTSLDPDGMKDIKNPNGK